MTNTPLLLDPAAVVADLVAEPAPAAPQQIPPAEAMPPAAAPELKDKRPFDPLKFRSRPDGSPIVGKQGFYMPFGFAKPKAVRDLSPKPEGAPEAGNGTFAHDSGPGAASVPPSAASGGAWGAAERAAASGVPMPEPGGQTGSAAAGPAPVDNSDEAAEVGTRALYFTVGILIGCPEEATLSAAEHANFHKAAAAYIRSTGWKGTPLTCLVLILCAYLLKTFQKPKAAAVVREWLTDFRKKKPVPVTVRASEPAAGPARNAPVSVMPAFSERSAA